MSEDGKNNTTNDSSIKSRRISLIHYDKTFMEMQVIAVFIIAIIIYITYIFGYNTSFEDPIATIKNKFINMQYIMIAISIGLTLLVSILSKKRKKLIRKLIFIAFISILMVIVQMTIKFNIDNKYDEECFEQFYEQANLDNEHEKGISIGLSGIRIMEAKEIYVKESIKLYNNFKIKTIIFSCLHVLIILLILYIITKLGTIEAKRERLAKDDLILNKDEEAI